MRVADRPIDTLKRRRSLVLSLSLTVLETSSVGRNPHYERASIKTSVGPQTFRHQDAPKYRPAQITIVVCWGVCCLDLALIYFYYRWQNTIKAAKRRDNLYVKLKDQEWMDLTDIENVELVYEL